ncbi:MAG: hypothetical protein JNL72_13250 [Flavipsychrobacter sp.]|nr:hypothetical protein [Flavipsychrobacter sp.]
MFKTKKLLTAVSIAMASVQPLAAQNVQVFPSHNKVDTNFTGQVYDALSTDYVPGSRLKQHLDFLDHEYAFPAKPRNMWEVGVGGGLYNIFGDVPGLMAWEDGGYGFHGHVRKAWGYVISSRLQYNYGIGKGVQWQESENYRYNPAWNQKYNAAGNAGDYTVDAIHYNYRMESHQLNFDVIATANNIRFHKARSYFCVYGFVGIGGLAYKTYVNTMNGQEAYNFDEILGNDPQIYENDGEIVRNLQAGMDRSYETAAESEAGRSKAEFGKRGLGGIAKTFQFIPSVGGGIQIRLGRHVNLSIEDRLSIPLDDDLLDGQRWAEQVWGSPVQTQRKDIINYLGLGFNFNIGSHKRNVEPLYWMNPMVYPNSQLSTGSHILFPEILLPDDDDDGITNSLDKCPNTPKGVAVDANGCPLDTDGDNVPDYKDWQLITPTECQPVDEHGIGKCPCPEDCDPKPIKPEVNPDNIECGDIDEGTLQFEERSTRLSWECKQQLDKLGTQLRSHPTCTILIKCFPKPLPRGVQSQKIAMDRLENVKEYLRNNCGIAPDRIRWKVDEYMDEKRQVVDYYVPLSPMEGWPVEVSPRNGNEDGRLNR